MRRLVRILIAGVLPACLVGACSVQRVPLRDPAVREAERPAAQDDKPYDFQADTSAAPAPVPAAAAPAAQPALETPESANFDSPAVQSEDLPLLAPTAPPATGQTQDGFRVQVLATADADAAERARADIRMRLGLPAYVRYEAPYYKVRVGDCATQADCQKLEAQLHSAGFATVWVVSDTIQR